MHSYAELACKAKYINVKYGRMEWIKCPICRNKTRNKIRPDTLLKNYPLFGPKCKNEVLIEVKDMQVNIVREPDAKTQ